MTRDRRPVLCSYNLDPDSVISHESASGHVHPWRVVARRSEVVAPSLPHDEGMTIDAVVEWSGDGSGSVSRRDRFEVDGEISLRERSTSPGRAVEEMRRVERRPGFRFLRVGWSVNQYVRAFAAACFHPSTDEQWIESIERLGLTKLGRNEILDGRASDVGRALRYDRFSIWIEPGSRGSLWALASVDSNRRLSVVARVDPRSVRLAENPEVHDAAHERSTTGHRGDSQLAVVDPGVEGRSDSTDADS